MANDINERAEKNEEIYERQAYTIDSGALAGALLACEGEEATKPDFKAAELICSPIPMTVSLAADEVVLQANGELSDTDRQAVEQQAREELGVIVVELRERGMFGNDIVYKGGQAGRHFVGDLKKNSRRNRMSKWVPIAAANAMGPSWTGQFLNSQSGILLIYY